MKNKKPIDGNAIIKNIRDQRAIQDANKSSFGSITNSKTGEGIKVTGTKGIPQNQSAFVQNKPQKYEIPTNLSTLPDDEAIYAEEEYHGGEGSYEPSYTPTQDERYSEMDEQELSANREEYLYDAGNFSNWMEDHGQNLEDVYNGFGKDVSKKDMDLFKDARNIKTESDAIRLGELNDMWLDMNGIDAEKYYQEGILEECGGACQERRQMGNAQAAEREESMIRDGDQPMAMSDEEFNKRYANLSI